MPSHHYDDRNRGKGRSYRGGGGNYRGGDNRQGGGFRDNYNRNRDDFSRRYTNKNMVNPWESGIAPCHSGMQSYGCAGTSRADSLFSSMSQMSHMGGNTSKIALNLLNAVLANRDSGYGQQYKMKQMDRGGNYDGRRNRGFSPPARVQHRDYYQYYEPNKTWDNHRHGSVEHFESIYRMRLRPFHKPSGRSKFNDKKKKDTDDEKAGSKESDDKKDQQGVTDAEEDEQEKEKENVEIPNEAFECFICDLNDFQSQEEYEEHLEGKNHDQLRSAYHIKQAAVLQLLRTDARLMAAKRMTNVRKYGYRDKTAECYKCRCNIQGGFQNHMKTAEHNLVQQFMITECCDGLYNPYELANHKVSVDHLKQSYLSQEKRKKDEIDEAMVNEKWESCMVDGEDPYSKIDEELNTFKSSLNDEDKECATLDDLRPYSPDTLEGCNYIETRSYYQCKKCCVHFFRNDKLAKQTHCRSHSHYHNVVHELKKIESIKVEALREEEELRMLAEESSRKAEEAARAEAHDGSDKEHEDHTMEDLNNMETVDETQDCDEEDGEEEEQTTAEADSISKDVEEQQDGEECETNTDVMVEKAMADSEADTTTDIKEKKGLDSEMKVDDTDGDQVTAEALDTGDGDQVTAEALDTGDGDQVTAGALDTGDGDQVTAEALDTGDGDQVTAEALDTGDGDQVTAEALDTGDGDQEMKDCDEDAA